MSLIVVVNLDRVILVAADVRGMEYGPNGTPVDDYHKLFETRHGLLAGVGLNHVLYSIRDRLSVEEWGSLADAESIVQEQRLLFHDSASSTELAEGAVETSCAITVRVADQRGESNFDNLLVASVLWKNESTHALMAGTTGILVPPGGGPLGAECRDWLESRLSLCRSDSAEDVANALEQHLGLLSTVIKRFADKFHNVSASFQVGIHAANFWAVSDVTDGTSISFPKFERTER